MVGVYRTVAIQLGHDCSIVPSLFLEYGFVEVPGAGIGERNRVPSPRCLTQSAKVST